jgi:single-stranded-DNA-specific exonuclease
MTIPTSIEQTAWTVNPYSWRASERLAESLGLPLVAAMVLCGRGLIDPDEARMFLECASPLPDPFLFAGMEGAVRVVSSAIDVGRRIVVHGDYDADGITATALLVTALRELGAQPEWYLPSRFEEGFGLSRRAVETIAGEGPGVLITVDCGVNYPDEVALAQTRGLEVIVVDHHHPGPRLPECHLVHQAVGDYPSGDLCGVGLALKVMHGLHIHRSGAARDRLPPSLERLLDLVAVGTIADLASLRGENRYYVREGLKLIAIGQRVGFRALASVSGCTGAVDSGTVAYRLAPRLNAAGRLADPSPPLRLLLAEDEAEAAALAAHLHELNGARQDVERQIFDEAVKQVEALPELPPVIVLAAAGWHEGVVGIVASRMVERYNRPAVLLGISDGVAKGSGRSITAYDLLSGLTACEHLLTVFGGHTQAVGLTLDAEQVGEFRRGLEEHAGRELGARDLTPAYRADAVLRGEDADTDTALALAALGPFGSDNPRPRVLLVDACVHEAEPTRSGGHLRCTVGVDGAKIRGIGFGLGDYATTTRTQPCNRTLGAQLRVDEWRGTLRPEFLVERIGSNGAVEQDGGDCWTHCPHAAAQGWGPSTPIGNEGRPDDVSKPMMPQARDLRDRPGRLSALAQVLATRESTLLLACAIPQTLPGLRQSLPLRDLSASEVECVGRGCVHSCSERLAAAHVALVEWDAGVGAESTPEAWAHVVALDPPYRAAHVGLLSNLAAKGAIVHLLYGAAERTACASLLRYLVHPRFAMVCLYRAMQGSVESGADLFPHAADIGRQEAGVILTWADLERASAMLAQLGIERDSPREAKLEARNISAYAAAEAEYEECLRLCQTL